MHDSKIKDYLIQRELGRGGMAVVYLAHDNKFDTQVAVKVLNKEYAHNDNIRKRFLAEARNMYRMSHPNIIKVTDLIDNGDTVAFVMEYIEGETLKEYLERKGKLKDEEIKNIFTQMLDAVEYVHKQNLVHRDIKPSNFMIDREGKIKLMDFGIAKNTDANSAEYTQTGTSMQMGTPMYMSPEQVHETKNVTAQSDIYSLGVVLWQMVTGKRPYDTKTLSSFQLQSKIVNEPLDKTNSHWDELIQKATAKDMASRFISANAFKNALNMDNNQKVVESVQTIVDSDIKQAPKTSPKPEQSSSPETKVNNENAPVREDVHLQSTKKNYLPVILIVALCITALVLYVVNGTISSSNYAEAEKAKTDSIAAAVPDKGGGEDEVGLGNNEIFTVVEKMPEFEGGEDKLREFLSKNIKYPAMARENGISGTVYITFVVEGDGKITDVKSLRGLGGGLTEEAIRVVKMMPNWTAGKQNGKPVRVQFTLPLKFTLR